MSDFLETIRESVLTRVQHMRIEERGTIVNTIDFCEMFRQTKSPIFISEIKFSSPSRGVIYRGDLSPVQIAAQYKQHGAHALSVLTEPSFFKGDIEYIRQIRTQLPDCPILLKDFVLSPLQIKQAQVYGASAVLLIVGFLEPALLRVLHAYALSLGLTPLVEVHDAAELEVALTLQPKVIGINNRNLKTLKIDLNTSRALIPLIPEEIFTVCESGIDSVSAIQEMSALGFDGFLIGSHLMQSAHPGEALAALLQSNNHEG
ncbi:MAG: indole-3-glycerol-phosphate synthase [Legionellaceae bacterium]|nr:indole-3-glycerol-phosphate synthase [Legionellaceae bacterium]